MAVGALPTKSDAAIRDIKPLPLEPQKLAVRIVLEYFFVPYLLKRIPTVKIHNIQLNCQLFMLLKRQFRDKVQFYSAVHT